MARAVLLLLVLVLAGPAAADDAEVARQLQEILQDDLDDADDDARLVPNTNTTSADDDGPDDPVARRLLETLASADVARLREAVEQFSVGDYAEGAKGVGAFGAGQAGGLLREWAEDRFEKDGLGRLLFSTAAGQTESLQAIGEALFDPRKSWCEVADVAWERAKEDWDEAAEDSAEALAKDVLNEVFGGGGVAATVGVSPGDLYLKVLKLDVEYFRSLEVRLGYRAGQALYEEYLALIRAKKPPDAAFDAVDHKLVLGDGTYLFRRHFPSDAAVRQLFERCRAEGSPDLLFCMDARVKAVEKEGRTSLCAETRKAGEPTRAAIRTSSDEVVALWRRLGGGSAANDAAAAAVAAARKPIGELQRLSEGAARTCDDVRGRAQAAMGACQLLHAREAQTAGLDADIDALAGCASLPSTPPDPIGDLAAQAAGRVQASVAAADGASSAACGAGEPSTVEGARAALRGAAEAAGRTRAAVAAARAALAELEALAAQDTGPDAAQARTAVLRATRDRLRGALAGLGEGAALAASCRGARASFGELAGRLGRMRTAALDRQEQVTDALRPAGRHAEAEQLREWASELVSTVTDCLAVRDAAADQVSALASEPRVSASESVLAQRLARANAAIAGCSTLDAAAAPRVSRADALLGPARQAADRLDAFETAADTCVANAAQWVDRLAAPRPAPTPAEGGPRIDTSDPRGRAPTAGVDTSNPGGGWSVGDARTVGGGPPSSGGSRPAPPAPPPGPDVSGLVAGASGAAAACNYGQALGLARQIAALDPQNAWLAANGGKLQALAQRQWATIGFLNQAQGALGAGDLRGAQRAIGLAGADAPGCMRDAIAGVSGGIATAIADQRARQAAANQAAAAAVLGTLIDSYNRGVAAAQPPPPPPAAGPGGGAGPGAPPQARTVSCGTTTKSGHDAPETVTVNVPNGGIARFSYNLYSVKDRMVVRYGGQTLLDTGCTSGSRTLDLQVPGGGSVTVMVQPACETPSTSWDFRLECPR